MRQLFILLSFLSVSASAVAAQPEAGTTPVTFSLSAPRASSVALAGTFNHWDPSAAPLAGPDRKGTWSLTLFLAPGRHEYLFVVNSSEWTIDPAAGTVDDGLGGRNSVITVRGD